MKTLTRESAINILVWMKSEGQNNWGGWGNYPSIPVSAQYLSYDTNHCQINLEKSVFVGKDLINCITTGRPVGQKWDKPISFSYLQEFFKISDSEVSTEISKKENAEKLKWLEGQLKVQSKFLENDDYQPFVSPIEKIFFRSEHSGDNFSSPLGKVIFGHSNFRGNNLSSVLTFEEVVEWKQIRKQGKNGPNKKRVFAPVSVPDHIAKQIQLHLDALKDQRINHLKNEVEKYHKELKAIKEISLGSRPN